MASRWLTQRAAPKSPRESQGRSWQTKLQKIARTKQIYLAEIDFRDKREVLSGWRRPNPNKIQECTLKKNLTAEQMFCFWILFPQEKSAELPPGDLWEQSRTWPNPSPRASLESWDFGPQKSGPFPSAVWWQPAHQAHLDWDVDPWRNRCGQEKPLSDFAQPVALLPVTGREFHVGVSSPARQCPARC